MATTPKTFASITPNEQVAVIEDDEEPKRKKKERRQRRDRGPKSNKEFDEG